MADKAQERSLGELFAELSRETATLVRQEMALATTEISAKAQKAVVSIGTAAAGGALAHAGFLVLLAAIVIALGELGIQMWLSALIVAVAAVATIAVGYFLVQKGLAALRRTSVVPRQTIESIKETASWTTRQGA
jgi:hypothetical protein